MPTIGFRAEKDKVHFAIVKGTRQSPILVDANKFSAPAAYSLGEALAWYRDRVHALVTQHHPVRGTVRLSETFLARKPTPTSLDSMFARARIEGVLLEALASKQVSVSCGKLQQIASGLGTKTAKHYLDEDEVRGLDWSSIKNANTREAILAAVSILEE